MMVCHTDRRINGNGWLQGKTSLSRFFLQVAEEFLVHMVCKNVGAFGEGGPVPNVERTPLERENLGKRLQRIVEQLLRGSRTIGKTHNAAAKVTSDEYNHETFTYSCYLRIQFHSVNTHCGRHWSSLIFPCLCTKRFSSNSWSNF
jgi:hypothetical protein